MKRSFATLFSRLVLLTGLLFLGACDSAEDRLAQHYERGLELLKADSTEQAVIEFRNALNINDKFSPARLELAKIYIEQGQAQAALANLNRIVDTDPANGPAQLELARLLLLAGQFEQAFSSSEIAVRGMPQNADALAVRSSAHFRLDNFAEAETDADAALAIVLRQPTAGAVKAALREREGKLDEALAIIDAFVNDGTDDIGLHLYKLRLHEQLGQTTAVGAHLERMTEEFPENVGIWQALVRLYVQEGRSDDAEAALRKLVALGTAGDTARLALLQFLIQNKGEEAARAELEAQIREAANKLPIQLELARFDYQTGRVDEAKTLLRNMLEATATDDNANSVRLELSRILLAEKDLSEAKRLADAVISTDAQNSDALAIRAAILAEWGQTEAAVLDLRAALNEAPEDPRLQALAANVYERNGNPTLSGESHASATQLSEYAPNIVMGYVSFLERTGQRNAIETILTEALNRHPHDRVLLAAMGALNLSLQNWDAALQVAERLTSIDATQSQLIRASALIGRDQTTEGITVLEGLAEDLDTAQSIHAILVSNYLRNGQRTTAIQYVDRLLEENPKNALALRIKATLETLEGNLQLAEGLFEKALQADPETASGYLAYAYFLAQNERQGEARQVIKRGIEAAPDNLLLHLRYADYALSGGDFDAAIEGYEKAFEHQPNSVLAANNLASILSDYRADDPEEIERAYSIARRLAGSRNPAFQDTLGWILYLRGDHEESLRYLIPAAEGLPQNPWARYHVGVALVAVGQQEEAKGHLVAALELAEDTPFPPREAIEQALEKLPVNQ